MSGLGLEARHSWAAGAAILGKLDEWPNVEIDDIEGLHSLGDFDAPSRRSGSRRGEQPLGGQRAGKTVTYTGRVRGRDLAELREGSDALLAAFDRTSTEEMVISPHPDYAAGGGGRLFRARCIDCKIPDEQVYGPGRSETYGFERDLTLTLRLDDPRAFDVVESNAISAAGAAAHSNFAPNPTGAGGAASWTSAFDAFFYLETLPTREGLPRTVDGALEFLTDGPASGGSDFPVVSGTQYTVSWWVLLDYVDGGAAISPLNVTNTVGTLKAAVAAGTVTPGGWQRVSVTFVADSTGTWRALVAQAGAGSSKGYVTGLQVEAGAAVSDLVYAGSGLYSAFSGVPQNSSSVRRARRHLAVVNDGTVDADPVVTIFGNSSWLTLRHRELDRVLYFDSSSVLYGGQKLVIDFGRRTILLNGVTPYNGLNREVSDWWDEGVPGLLPGVNNIELYRTNASGPGVEFRVDWRDAYAA